MIQNPFSYIFVLLQTIWPLMSQLPNYDWNYHSLHYLSKFKISIQKINFRCQNNIQQRPNKKLICTNVVVFFSSRRLRRNVSKRNAIGGLRRALVPRNNGCSMMSTSLPTFRIFLLNVFFSKNKTLNERILEIKKKKLNLYTVDSILNFLESKSKRSFTMP